MRHTTVFRLLQSGVDISVIALWLGHESLEADLAAKEQALQKPTAVGKEVLRFKALDKVLAFLAAL